MKQERAPYIDELSDTKLDNVRKTANKSIIIGTVIALAGASTVGIVGAENPSIEIDISSIISGTAAIAFGTELILIGKTVLNQVKVEKINRSNPQEQNLA